MVSCCVGDYLWHSASGVHHVLAGPISSEGASSGVVGNSQDIDEAMSTLNGRIKQRPQSSGVCHNTCSCLNTLLAPLLAGEAPATYTEL